MVLDTTNRLFSLDTSTPGTTNPLGPITGLVAGDSVVAIDFRPFEGLSALGVNGTTAHLYNINPATAVATQLGGEIALPQSSGVIGAETDFGFDFDPTVDLIRVVANNGDNFLLNPFDGTVAAADVKLSPGAPVVVGAAYTNNFPSATSTTLYGIDANTDQLLIQGGPGVPGGPNGGILTLVGNLGVSTTNLVGFDIITADSTNQAFAALETTGLSQLYSINLASGAATLIGDIGLGLSIRGLAVIPATYDLGDAPDSYRTSGATDGARHLSSAGPFLGVGAPDFEVDGRPTADAEGDDVNGIDDEDGVVLPTTLVAGLSATATVTATADGLLDAWIDFDGSGTFDENEQIAMSLPVFAGDNSVSFTVPAGSVVAATFARFRISTAGDLDPSGYAADGEVEDYQVQIAAPTPRTATLIDHTLVVVGTARGDVIVVEPRPVSSSQIRVKIDGKLAGTFDRADVQQIRALGLGGNDTIIVSAALIISAELHGNEGNDKLVSGNGNDRLFGENGSDKLYALGGNDEMDGGSGNDYLNGGAGSDVLLGGAGDDTLLGFAGRDILIGGLGSDFLNGGAADDILIAGTTAHDANAAALHVIFSEWTSNQAVTIRISDLISGGGSNGAILLNPGITVQRDGAVDRLIGGPGSDWFLRSLADGDRLLDFNAVKDRKDAV